MDKTILVLCMMVLVAVSATAVTFSDRLPATDSTSDLRQKIGITLTDADGIRKDKIVFQVNGFDFALNDPRMSYNEATGRLEYQQIRDWDQFDKVDVYVSAEDLTGERGELRFSFRAIGSLGPLPIQYLRYDSDTLRWEKPESMGAISKYKVYRSTSLIRDSGKSGKFLADSTGLSYADTTRESGGTRYFYAVTAVDETSNEGKIAFNITTEDELVPVDGPTPYPFPGVPPYPPITPPVQLQPPYYDGYAGFGSLPYALPPVPLSGRVEWVPKGEPIFLAPGETGNADFSITNGLPFEVTIRFEMNPGSMANGTVFLFPQQSQQLRYGRAAGFKVAPGETTFVSLPVKASERALPGNYLLGIDMVARNNEGNIVYTDRSAAAVGVFAPLPVLPTAPAMQQFAPTQTATDNDGRIEAALVDEPAKTLRIEVENVPTTKSSMVRTTPANAAAEGNTGATGFFTLESLGGIGTLNAMAGILVIVVLLTYGLIQLSNDRIGQKKW